MKQIKVYIKMKGYTDGWAIYGSTSNEEIAFGFETYGKAMAHAETMAWVIEEVPEQSHTPQAQETFAQFLSKNPYKETRSFTKEDWESSMYEQWKESQPPVQGDIVQENWSIEKDRPAVVRINKFLRTEFVLEIENCGTVREYDYFTKYGGAEKLAQQIASLPSLLRENQQQAKDIEQLREVLAGLVEACNVSDLVPETIQYNKATELLNRLK